VQTHLPTRDEHADATGHNQGGERYSKTLAAVQDVDAGHTIDHVQLSGHAYLRSGGGTTQQAPGAQVPLAAHPDNRATLAAFAVIVV
jgi:hypothetical protein